MNDDITAREEAVVEATTRLQTQGMEMDLTFDEIDWKALREDMTPYQIDSTIMTFSGLLVALRQKVEYLSGVVMMLDKPISVVLVDSTRVLVQEARREMARTHSIISNLHGPLDENGSCPLEDGGCYTCRTWNGIVLTNKAAADLDAALVQMLSYMEAE